MQVFRTVVLLLGSGPLSCCPGCRWGVPAGRDGLAIQVACDGHVPRCQRRAAASAGGPERAPARPRSSPPGSAPGRPGPLVAPPLSPVARPAFLCPGRLIPLVAPPLSPVARSPARQSLFAGVLPGAAPVGAGRPAVWAVGSRAAAPRGVPVLRRSRRPFGRLARPGLKPPRAPARGLWPPGQFRPDQPGAQLSRQPG